MLSLLFIFLAATISADNLLAPKNLFKDPEAFVSTFSRADKETLTTLLDMVNGLIQDGIDDMAKATADQGAAADAHTTATTELEQATTELDEAKKELEITTGTVGDKENQLKEHEATLNAATGNLDDAQKTADDAATHLEKTSKRVSQEKTDFELILDYLVQYEDVRVGFAETNRKLLSQFIMVDGDSIDDIRTKVQELITVGENEEKAAAEANTAAQTALTEAQEAHNEASGVVGVTTGELEAARLAKTTAANKETSKASVHTAAVTKEEQTSLALASADKWLQEEKVRVDAESATLTEVKDLLEDLISKAQ